jgi:glycerol transport system substrate-binding protein
MKVGYQDAGSWTIPNSTTGKTRAAAWLWAQFCVSKSVSLKKFLVGGTPIRKSTINAPYLTERIDDYGGLIEFYRSPEEKKWTPTGLNVPYYPGLAPLWWDNVARAITGELTPQQAMDRLAKQQDDVMTGLKMARYSPVLNPEKPADEWLNRPGGNSPKREIPAREPPATVDYEELVKQWRK